jgi:hypothetical protein
VKKRSSFFGGDHGSYRIALSLSGFGSRRRDAMHSQIWGRSRPVIDSELLRTHAKFKLRCLRSYLRRNRNRRHKQQSFRPDGRKPFLGRGLPKRGEGPPGITLAWRKYDGQREHRVFDDRWAFYFWCAPDLLVSLDFEKRFSCGRVE